MSPSAVVLDPQPAGARFALRAATAQAHDRLDALMSRFDLTDRAGYGRFLSAQAGALFTIEGQLDAAGVATLVADWPERRRSDALRSDLLDLGLREPQAVAVPALSRPAGLLGALYVLEGSRLGGAVLVREVPSGLPTRYLSPGNPSRWRALVKLLDQRLSSEGELAAATDAALATFEMFARSASAVLGPDAA